MSQSPFPPAVISEAVYWGRFLGEEWSRDFAEAPVKIHASTLAPDGTREWERSFLDWVEGRNADEMRQRTTKVMRKLRRVSPRAYEVLYRAMVQGESFESITTWLNERAVRNNIPLPAGKSVHYTQKDAVALFIAGVSYARFYW